MTAPPTRGGCAGEATRRRSGATTSTALKTRTPGSPTCRPSSCQGAPPDRDLRVRDRRIGSARSTSAGLSWRASATSRASRRAAATVRVTLKSGTVFDLDRFAANDFDDGVRVWDGRRGVVDLDSLRIRTIELLPTAALGAVPDRLHGTVRTRQGDFTGFVQWDRKECVGSDELDGHTADGELSLRFDTIRSIARRSRDSSLVTLLDGREIVLSGTREVGDGNRGIYVDDRRYGRVLVSWDAFERVDFSARRQRPRLRRLPAGAPAHGQRHHPRRPPPHRPAGLRPRRERDHRDARRPIPGRGLHHPLRPDRLDRARRPRRARRPARQGDPP